MRAFFLACAVSAASAAAPSPATSPPPVALGSRVELFADRFLIERLDGVELRLAHPVDRGAVLAFDAPWEGRYVAYVTVVKDGARYRLYYRGKPTRLPSGSDDETTCLAESTDGIRWTRPELGLHEVAGTRRNNVVLDKSMAPLATNFSPFVDTRPGVPPDERYKSLAGSFDGDVGAAAPPGEPRIRSSGGLHALVSPDGVHWRRLSDAPVTSRATYPFACDSSLCPAFWSEHERRYVAYIRTRTTRASAEYARTHRGARAAPARGGDFRWVGRTTSEDFRNWTPVALL